MEALRFIRGPTFLSLDRRRHKHAGTPQLGGIVPWAAVSDGTFDDDVPVAAAVGAGSSGNWFIKIMRIGSLGKVRDQKETDDVRRKRRQHSEGEGVECDRCGEGDGAEGCSVEEMEDRVEFDRDSFSRLLLRVSLAETELYTKIAYLCNLAYAIPMIEPASLLNYHGLRLVISSLERKAHPSIAENSFTFDQVGNSVSTPTLEGDGMWTENSAGIGASVAYQLAGSAASYLQSFTGSIVPFLSRKKNACDDPYNAARSNECEPDVRSSDITSFASIKNTVTAVVDGKEMLSVSDFNSGCPSPCEWFICDDDRTGTRYFVIQGSESLASWQVNLLFEPIQFEKMDALVHRGIYEAAKRIYPQILPEVISHLKSRGDYSTLRFTGHSLGGSLALLLNLMLLIRRDVPPTSLLPVITFGAPSIMCGGDYLLQKLSLPSSHVQAIVMHRDIVPRAFSCRCPEHVANILKVFNGNFRNHKCLENQNLLYSPMGKLLILQPEEKYSPPHHLLPSGCGLYLLGHSLETKNSVRLLQAAQSTFLNSPHPLEVLSDCSAYGSEGTVYRDHDPNAYFRSMLSVFRQELKVIQTDYREHPCLPLVSMQGLHIGFLEPQNARAPSISRHHFSFTRVLHGGRETLKRFGRMVASQHLHVFIVFILPPRLLLLGTLPSINYS